MKLLRFYCLTVFALCVVVNVIASPKESYTRHKANYQRVDGGWSHTLELRNGVLYAYGSNVSGELGDGTTTGKNSPFQIGGVTNWKNVSSGLGYSMGLQNDGTLWSWGDNTYGQLGDNSNTKRTSPVQIGSADDWAKIIAGHRHSFAIKSDGTLWAWGYNGYGQLGTGTVLNTNNPVQVGTATDWVSVSGGIFHSIGIRADGTLWAWGGNGYGQLGDGTQINKSTPVQIGSATDWVAVTTGIYHSVGLKADGTLWAWGYNNYGQLGDGTTTNRTTPVKIGSANNWVSIAGGQHHTLALRADGTVWAWGWNSFSQLGDGTTTTRTSPVQVGTGTDWVSIATGAYYSIALKADGKLSVWGQNNSGQLGDGTNTGRSTPVQTHGASDWVKISAAEYHSVSLKADGTLWSWGHNTYGQLGDGTTTLRSSPVQVGNAHNWVSVITGQSHSLGLKANGTLWSWGRNSNGQLGDGTAINRVSPVQVGSVSNWVNVSAGAFHSIGLRADGTIWSWGNNAYGQLGDGTSTNKSSPTQIGSADDWVSVSAGRFHSLGIKADGTIWAWGLNAQGQLGDGTLTNKFTPVQVGSADDWVSVTAGSVHSVALKADGTLWSWGDNTYGQLGDGTTTLRSAPVQVGSADDWVFINTGWEHSSAIKSDGTLWVWGRNYRGQLGDGTTVDKSAPAQIGNTKVWAMVSGGSNFSTALKVQRSEYCGTGNNQFGQLGNGSLTNQNSFACVGGAASIVSQPADSTVCAGDNASFIITASNATGYQWQVSVNNGSSWNNVANNSIYSGATSATLSIVSSTTNMNGYQYRCIAQAITTPDTSNVVELNVNEIPAITAHPQNQNICVGVNTSLSITTSGVVSTYQWQVSVNNGSTWTNVTNAGIYSGATTSSLSLTNTTSVVNGYQYRCSITGPCITSQASNVATVTVGASFATITSQPVSKTVCSGDNAVFTTSATSTVAINYQWQRLAYSNTWVNLNNGNHNGGNYSGANTNTLTVNNVTPVISGSKYRCVYNTGCLPATLSNTVSITVNKAPNISATSANQSICQGQSAAFFVNASGAGLSYQWQVNSGSGWSNLSNGGGYANVTTNLMIISGTPASFNGNQYRCIVTGTCAPTTAISAPSTLTVHAPVVIISQPKTSDSFCSGGSTTIPLAATGTGLSYQWYLSSGSTAIALTNSGVYSGVTTNTLSINGITESNNYTNYQYYCIISGSCNNVASSVSTIKVLGKPTITLSPSNETICNNNNVSLTVQAKGGNVLYQWQLNSGSGWSNLSNTGVYSGANTNTLLMTSANTSMSGNQYRCLVTGTCTPSVTSGVSTLTVHPYLSPSVAITSTNTDICAGSSITFSASTINAGAGPAYKWLKNGVVVGSNSSTYTSSTWSNNDEIRCRIVSNYTCPTSPTALSNRVLVKVTQYATPTIAITSSSGNVECSGVPVTFKAAITNGGTSPNYEWQLNGSIVGSNGDSYVTNTLNDGDQVKCILTSSFKCPAPKTVTSNTIQMTINQTTKSSIVIGANPDTSICDGDTVTLYSAYTNGGITPQFQWMRNGVDIQGATNATLVTDMMNDGDLIECRLISSALCVFPEISEGVTFDVGQILTTSVDVQVSYNGNNSYTFTALPVNGGSSPAFQWYKNNVLIQGQSGATYTSSSLEKFDKIYVKMTSSYPCVTSKVVDSRQVTTSIRSLKNNLFNEVGLYPNPNSGKFTISAKLKKALVEKDIVVRVTNAIGQTVYQQVYNASGTDINLKIDLKEYSTGTYHASLIVGSNITNINFILNK